MLIRAGHTEASVDLARLAGLYPAAVICEIMNDDGTMARMPDLVALRAAPRPQDRRHRGSHRLPAAQRPSCARHRQDERDDGGGRQIRSARLRDDGRAAASTSRWSRAICRRPARCWCACTPSTCSATCSASARRARARQIACSLRMIEKEGRGVVVLIRDLRPKSVSEWIGGRVQPAQPAAGARERRRGRDRRRLADTDRPRRARHGAADQFAGARLRRPRGLRIAHRRHAQDRVR